MSPTFANRREGNIDLEEGDYLLEQYLRPIECVGTDKLEAEW